MTRFRLILLLGLLFLPHWAGAAEEMASEQDEFERVFIVSEYRYEPAGESSDSDIGQSLCGARCNSMSVDYLNYTGPGGWRLIKVADKRELTVDLNNPYLAGKCICVADEYTLKVNDLYMSDKNPNGKEEK